MLKNRYATALMILWLVLAMCITVISALADNISTCTSPGVTINDYIPPKLTLINTVVNDNGGTKQASDFILKIDGNEVKSGVAVALVPGAHTASIGQLTGYSASKWQGDCAADGSINLNSGDVKTCTIVSNDIQPRLTVTKVVVNDNGGAKAMADFPLFVDETPVANHVQKGFNAGTYTVGPIPNRAYKAAAAGDCAANGTITLNPGDIKSCNITINDIQPKLIVIKTVINDDGGTAELKDFQLFVDSTPVKSWAATGLNPGTYTVTETQLPGYKTTIDVDCEADGRVTLDVGDVKYCTVVNDDLAPAIALAEAVKLPAADNACNPAILTYHSYINMLFWNAFQF